MRTLIPLLPALLLPCAGLAQTASVSPTAPAASVEAPALGVFAVDLRPKFDAWALPPRRQGSRPTCSVFTVAGGIEYAVARQQGFGSRLSVEFLNWASNQTCAEKDDGSFFSDLWKGFQAYGACVEAEMPYRPKFTLDPAPSAYALADAKTRQALPLELHWIKEWNVNTGLTQDHLSAIKATLASGWPVCGGFRWPKQAVWTNGILQMCPTNAVYDGHSVLLVGYREDSSQPGGGVFVFRNTAGDGRDGAMPFGYAEAFMNDAAWIGDRETRLVK